MPLLIKALCAIVAFAAGAAIAGAPDPAEATLMRAAVYDNYGSPEVLRLEQIAKPVPNDDQVLVRVRAASLNPLDWHYLRGTPYLIRLVESGLFKPRVPRLGIDMAGEIEAVGKNVTQFKPGDAVFGFRYGAFADYVVASEKSLALKPANISFEQAAAVPIAGVSALQSLRDKGGIQPGYKVLINGASGGVGTFAVQIAKSFGAEVSGVCSTRNVALVRALGADHVFDYKREDFTTGGQRYDLILDMVGNHSLTDLRGVMTAHGTLVAIGNKETGLWLGPVVGVLKTLIYAQFVSQRIVGLLAQQKQDDLEFVAALMRAGKLTPVIDRRYPLSELPDAVRYVEEGHTQGKVVITMDGETALSFATAGNNTEQTSPIGSFAFAFALLVVVVISALTLNRRYQQNHLGNSAYRWGYCFALLSLIGGVCLGFMLESGTIVWIGCSALYAVLAWFFAQRRRWAWITLTILSFNPVIWIVNTVYLRRRWREAGP